MSDTQIFVCECGKQFDKIRGMTGHQANCSVHKKILEDKRKARRLPNGMFKCENPDCQKEHDGSYASGHFCCKKCAAHVAGLNAAKSGKLNGTRYSYFKEHQMQHKRAEYGRWKCIECDFIFNTRAELQKHNRCIHGRKRFSWNKGLTKETSLSIANASIKVSNGVKKAYAEGRLTGKCKDPEKEILRRQKISETMKKNPNAGGKRERSGHGIQGWYKGFYCDSSWELAVIIYWIDHNIQFERCKESFEYEFNNAKHQYHPDYKFPTGEYIEVKGAEKTLQWKAKLSQFPKDKVLIVIGVKEIDLYLNYAIQKYGKNFTNAYEEKRIVKS